MRATGAAVVACLCACTATVTAQVRVVRHGDERLAGIAAVDVLVNIGGDGSACRPQRQALQAAARDVFRTRGLAATVSEAAPSDAHTVRVIAQSAAVGRTCVTALSTELVAHVAGIPEGERQLRDAWGSLLIGELSLLDKRALVRSAVRGHHQEVARQLRQQIDAIATRIRGAPTP